MEPDCAGSHRSGRESCGNPGADQRINGARPNGRKDILPYAYLVREKPRETPPFSQECYRSIMMYKRLTVHRGLYG